MSSLKKIAWVAGHEFRETIRDNWVIATGAMLLVISLAISYFGLVHRGQTGLQNFEVTVASLVSMVIYLVPLIALLIGYASISGEREQGSLSLLLSLPVSGGEIMAGKFLGLALAVTVAAGSGLGASGLLIMLRAGSEGWLNYLYFILSTLGLGFVFLSLGLLISVLARSKASAAAGAIFTWFFFTFIYDLMILGLTMALNKRVKISWLADLLLVNPGDIFRVANLLHFDSLKASLGLTDQLTPVLINDGLIACLFLAWILCPLLLASRMLGVQDA